MTPLQEQIREEFEKRFAIRLDEITIEKGKEPDNADWVEAGKRACLDVLQSHNEELAKKIEEKKLIEASFPGSPFTLDWKMGHNKAIEKVLTIIKSL